MTIITTNAIATASGNAPAELEPGQNAFNLIDDIAFIGDGGNVAISALGTSTTTTTGKGFKSYLLPRGPKNYTFQASKTLALTDGNLVLTPLHRYTGSTAATLTIPLDTAADFTLGTAIRIMRGVGAGALTIAAPGVTLSAPDGFLGALHPGEIIEIQKIAANSWVGHFVNNRQIEILPYTFLTRATWVATGLASAASIPITPAIQGGRISVGLQTETSGGVFAIAGAAGSVATTREVHGYYANAVNIRRSINHATTPTYPLHFDDSGVRRLVFGLLHTTAADGAAIGANNLNLSFVYETTGGTLVNTTISGDIEFELIFAVAGDDIPFAV
jgi:hypothetical protein